MKIEYHKAIKGELQNIIDYYNKSSRNLGYEFLDEFEHNIITIATNPNIWMIVEKDIRRVLMNRFPFIIYYKMIDNENLRVLVVKHQRQHPNYGLNRK